VAQTLTTLACGTTGEAVRLAAALSAPGAWAGTPPDKVEANNAVVELRWVTAAQAAPVAAVTAVLAVQRTASATLNGGSSPGLVNLTTTTGGRVTSAML
jgi:hypothetical protein